MTITQMGAISLTLLALAGCGGDDENESADTQPATPTAADTAPAPAETTPTTDTATAPATDDDVPAVSQADARSEAFTAAIREADGIEGADLYFPKNEDIDCTAPEATQEDNLNQRAPTWTCTMDAETNGFRCKGEVIIGSKGEDRLNADPVIERTDLDCGKV